MSEVKITLRAGSSIGCGLDDIEIEYAKQKLLAEFQAFVAGLTVETTNFDVKHIQMFTGDLATSTPSYEDWLERKNEEYRRSTNLMGENK